MNKPSWTELKCLVASTSMVLSAIVFGDSNIGPLGVGFGLLTLVLTTCLTVRAVKWHQRQAGLDR